MNQALIDHALRDPHAAMVLLVDRFGSSVHGVVRRFLGSHPDHDDVVQNAFCAMLDGIGQVREPEKLGGWVRAIAVNAVLQQLRKHRLQLVLPYKFFPIETSRDLVRDVEARDLLRRAQSLLDMMPDEERVILLLHHVERLSSREVAKIYGLSLATVKRRLARARERFRRLAAHDPETMRLLPRFD